MVALSGNAAVFLDEGSDGIDDSFSIKLDFVDVNEAWIICIL